MNLKRTLDKKFQSIVATTSFRYFMAFPSSLAQIVLRLRCYVYLRYRQVSYHHLIKNCLIVIDSRLTNM